MYNVLVCFTFSIEWFSFLDLPAVFKIAHLCHIVNEHSFTVKQAAIDMREDGMVEMDQVVKSDEVCALEFFSISLPFLICIFLFIIAVIFH